MYFPYLRGKRHELSALEKLASVLNPQKVKPLIEPVKSKTQDLEQVIQELNTHNIQPLVIINPIVGELSGSNILSLTQNSSISFIPCISFTNDFISASVALAHQLMNDKVEFATYFREEPTSSVSAITSAAIFNTVFTTQSTSSQFLSQMPKLVKIQDHFQAQSPNANYPLNPYIYSDSHLTYTQDVNAVGFGDFQIVGESYSESGGPARSIAIHISYINSSHKDYMFIKHCVSTMNANSPTNPSPKFLQALGDLVNFANATPDVDQTTIGFQELLNWHQTKHYPNLGPIKESSMMHHIETIAKYI